jgi:putative aminopeptidase FrvX
MNKHHYALLTELLTQPTAPFREEHVVGVAARTLRIAGVPFFRDPIGNIVVGCESQSHYLRLVREKNREPLRLFIAHMDHPGFHGVRWISKRRLRVKWHGGSPIKHLTGSRVWLATDDDILTEGKLGRVRLTKTRHGMDTADVNFSRPLTGMRPTAAAIYGAFQFRAPVWRVGRRLYTKAADDLVGVFSIIDTAIKLFSRDHKQQPPFLGLLTRGEEVGFIGAIGHFELGWLSHARRPIVCVSLETSRTLPGAVIGKGPVVRLGDRRTVFNPNHLKVLTDIAQKILPKKHQRRIMDGGTCEATVATVYGLPAIGISVPLGNYHNQGFEGAPGYRRPEGPAPEFVHLDDIEGMLKLCQGLMQKNLPWTNPWNKQQRLMRKNLKRYNELL